MKLETASDTNIYVTKPYMPDLSEFIPYLNSIWSSNILTNGGPFHQELESALCDYLGVQYISLFSNGTLALLVALQALEVKGSVITTPYSFVATAHSIVWNNCKPIFVDIDPATFNIDISKIESAITEDVSCIMPVHCYGSPCDHESLENIASKYGLNIIYDAAHAFGVKDKNGSILNYGDLSILSFHATKVFNTFEGGAIVCHTLEMKNKIDRLKNFGFNNEVSVSNFGINAKMPEINAAFGLLQLKHINAVITRRGEIDALYREKLHGVKGIKLFNSHATVQNYTYFPILVDEDYSLTRDELYNFLKDKSIFTRRYFYPLITEFEVYKEIYSTGRASLIEAYNISEKILCLPIYPSMSNEDVQKVSIYISNM
jgi:dTDP-4-amino-4,6-dideoxygalactose transaminase